VNPAAVTFKAPCPVPFVPGFCGKISERWGRFRQTIAARIHCPRPVALLSRSAICPAAGKLRIEYRSFRLLVVVVMPFHAMSARKYLNRNGKT